MALVSRHVNSPFADGEVLSGVDLENDLGGAITEINGNIEDVNIAGDACIMLCPSEPFHCVTGEDLTNGPFANTYWSNSCECTNEMTSYNLTIWAVLCGATATEEATWGQLRTLYR